jgi:FkbM family methyltransferase
MKSVLVTGASGLIGSECVTYFDQIGWRVHGIDNNMRMTFFGPDGDTNWNLQRLRNSCSNFGHHDLDIRDRDRIPALVKDFRPPVVSSATSPIRVRVTRLDDFVRESRIERVDFIKLDVEGAELSVLKGASDLPRRPRPVIHAEVEDIRTELWGYRASEIVLTLEALGCERFQPQLDGTLIRIGPEREEFQANLTAVPNERREEVLSRMNQVC